YPARVTQIIELGKQERKKFGTDEIMGHYNQILVTFELPTETHVFKKENGPQPVWIHKFYWVSFHEKSGMYQLINACNLKVKDINSLDELLGCALQVNVDKTEKGKNKITAVSKLMKGMKVEKPSREFSFDIDNSSAMDFKNLPEFLQKLISNSQGFGNTGVGKQLVIQDQPRDEDDLPY